MPKKTKKNVEVDIELFAAYECLLLKNHLDTNFFMGR